jgi:hypothetical protein
MQNADYEGGAGAFDFLDAVGSLCGPDERLGFLVVAFHDHVDLPAL